MAPGRYSTFFRSSVDLPRSQSSCPVEASRLQLTHASERAAGPQASSPPTAINQTERRKENIRVQQSLLVGHQLKPEQCSKRSGSQGQSEPLIFEGADHVASAAAPNKPSFQQEATFDWRSATQPAFHQGNADAADHRSGLGNFGITNGQRKQRTLIF